MAALPAEIQKPLQESLTADDLQIAYELAKALPQLQRAYQGTAPVTLQQAGLATDCMKDASRIRTFLWDRDTEDVDRAFKLHRSLTAKRALKVKFFDGIVSIAKSLIGRRQMEEQRKADDERRRLEEQARQAAETQRQAEVDARLAEAAEAEAAGKPEMAEFILQEAQDAAAAPAIPISVPEIAPAKIEGTSVSYKLVGTVTDAGALVRFLAETQRNDLINELIDWKQSGLNAALKRGLNLSGVAVERQPLVRNISQR